MTEPTGAGPIRLLLVDDQALVRAGFRMVLDAQPDMTVVGEAGDGQAALDLLATTGVDVVLMDIRMPRMDGVAATAAICAGRDATAPGPRVVVLTTFDLDEYVYAALRAGASGFLLKDAGPADLLAAVRAVHQGDSVIAPSTTRRLLEHFLPRLPEDAGSPAPETPGAPGRPAAPERPGAPDFAAMPPAPVAGRPTPTPGPDPRLAALTAREIEVLTAVAQGLTNGEIAATFFLAEATVKTHIGRILHKLGLRDRVQMVLFAYETGLVAVRPRS